MTETAGAGKVQHNFNDKTAIADLIFKGEALSEDFGYKIGEARLELPNVMNNLQNAKNNLERIEAVEDAYNSFPTEVRGEPAAVLVLKKDHELARILFEKGEKCSESKSKLRYFNLALLFAHPNGPEYLFLEIYRQRASEHLKLEDKKASAKDLRLALEYGSGHGTDQVVFIDENKKQVADDLKASADPSCITKRTYMNKKIFSIEGPPHPKIPVAADCLRVAFNPSKGRHIVATKDLDPGTTIVVENPYVGSLNEAHRWNTDHCGFCWKKTSSLIPCPNCVFAMYCDDECRINAQNSGHSYECLCMSQLHSLDIAADAHIAFLAICKAGPFKLWDLYTSTSPDITREFLKGFNFETGIYEEDSYYPVSKLASHENKAEMPRLTVLAMILVDILNWKTNFFYIIRDEEVRRNFINFVAVHMLHHLTSVKINSFGLEEVAEKRKPLASMSMTKPQVVPIISAKNVGQIRRKESVQNMERGKLQTAKKSKKATNANSGEFSIVAGNDNQTVPFVSVVYPFISLFSHSCFPNAFFEHLINGRMAVITTCCIKSGEEITISYNQLHWSEDFQSRQLLLKENYGFACTCVPCVCSWPKIIRKTEEDETSFICSNCSDKFAYSEIAKSNPCLLIPTCTGSEQYACGHCKSVFNVQDLIANLRKYTETFKKACELATDDNPIAAIPLVIDYIKFLQRNLSPPCNRFINATNFLVLMYRNIYERFL